MKVYDHDNYTVGGESSTVGARISLTRQRYIKLGISVLGSVRHGPDPYAMVPRGAGRLGFKAKMVRGPEALAHARPRGSGRDQCPNN